MNNEEIINLTAGDTYAPNYVVNAFTKTSDDINIEVDNATVKCITSKNNKFSLDEEGNLVVNTITSNNESSGSVNLLDVYPIGSIYMSANGTDPSTLFGGKWSQLEDRFLLGAGSSYTSGSTGGEATHKLTVAEMPSHSHNIGYDKDAVYNASGKSYSVHDKGTSGADAKAPTSNTGSTQAHNNMPPYLVVYMWQRTA